MSLEIQSRYLTEAELLTYLGGQEAILHIEPDRRNLQIAVSAGEEELDSYLVKRYELPTTPANTPVHMKQKLACLIKFHLKSMSVNAVPSQDERNAYKDVLRFLDLVRMAQPNSPVMNGLTEKLKTGELRMATPDLDTTTQPVLSGRLDGMRPSESSTPVPDPWTNPPLDDFWS